MRLSKRPLFPVADFLCVRPRGPLQRASLGLPRFTNLEGNIRNFAYPSPVSTAQIIGKRGSKTARTMDQTTLNSSTPTR